MDLAISSRTSFKHLQIIGIGVLFVICLISTQIGHTEGRTLTRENDFFPTPFIKRNTWWTKKSMNNMDARPQNNFEPVDQSYNKCQDSLEVYVCYVEKCVVSFASCARQADSEELFSACKVLNNMCASSCANAGDKEFLRL
ncbi:hypothetical protein ACF0H5_004443 [Mactra antiquata]